MVDQSPDGYINSTAAATLFCDRRHALCSAGTILRSIPRRPVTDPVDAKREANSAAAGVNEYYFPLCLINARMMSAEQIKRRPEPCLEAPWCGRFRNIAANGRLLFPQWVEPRSSRMSAGRVDFKAANRSGSAVMSIKEAWPLEATAAGSVIRCRFRRLNYRMMSVDGRRRCRGQAFRPSHDAAVHAE